MSLCQPTPEHLREEQREILRQMLMEKQRLDEERRQCAVGVGGRKAIGSSPEIHLMGVASTAGTAGAAGAAGTSAAGGQAPITTARNNLGLSGSVWGGVYGFF